MPDNAINADALALLLLLASVGSGLVGGVFFAFSAFVMKALADLPAATGVAAMQRINVVVLNPLFLGLFVGTALLALACIGMAALAWGSTRSWLLFAAGLSYTLGAFGVTVAFNVPRNERLARLAPDSPELLAYWPVYVRAWLAWNHVRTLASSVAAVLAAAALAA
jgi:uncharacterized membrane protein